MHRKVSDLALSAVTLLSVLLSFTATWLLPWQLQSHMKRGNLFSSIVCQDVLLLLKQYLSRDDKTNKVTVRPAKDHPGHRLSLIRVFAVRSMGS